MTPANRLGFFDSSPKMAYSYDYIIVGSGIAGLYAALLAREHGSVLVLTKGSIDDCNTPSSAPRVWWRPTR